VEAITPGEDGQDKYAMDMLAEITTAFGESDEEKDEAKDLVEQLWRCIIWETEKRRVINGRSVSGLEVPWEDLEVEHVQ
jgi:hypothetical protein